MFCPQPYESTFQKAQTSSKRIAFKARCSALCKTVIVQTINMKHVRTILLF